MTTSRKPGLNAPFGARCFMTDKDAFVKIARKS